MLKLNFDLPTSQERAEYVNKYMDQFGTKYTQKELKTIADYIIYGKDNDKDGTSAVDRKEIQIKPKYNSYQKKEPESLEALMESPAFDERIFEKSKSKFKVKKPKIDRSKDFDVPGIQELWAIIDDVQHIIDVSKGKVEDPSVKKREGKELYKLSHYVIELRRQQFVLRDMVKPTICRTKTTVRPSYYEVDNAAPWDVEGSDFAIAPLGIITANRNRFENPRSLEEKDYYYNSAASNILDFRNPLHIYYLFENYTELREEANKDPESTLWGILETLDFYRDFVQLEKQQEKILDLKIAKVPNDKITSLLREEFGLTHSANYISTIYKQKICEKISEGVQLNFDYYMAREDLSAWKKCTCCGKDKLRDTREFMRRSRSSDGLASTCKKCCKDKRESKKGG